ncbi:dihydropteroate synthase [Mariniblastus fucicola]|uniref:Dihydropteroate synthase n=1 Tax=Mariniblastus fucicola TaxID=980251 RepID=A0A5B9P2M8_9BACT|nr:dihydropteroate synthase [Mariniblastus fucicola]QEG20608.1 Dihydropteroate synthase [Mariniblastus fucicola]
MLWSLKTRTLSFESRPLLMAIVNVTPDSFSDGGKFHSVDRAVEHALQLVADGADILDIGGESTRPYATPVSESEELDRVIPVIERLAAETDTPLSIDTSKAVVARTAINAGAEIINDVTGLEGDAKMLAVAVDTGAGVCAMHMQGTPQTMQDDPQYEDVVTDILNYLEQRKSALLAAGIEPAKICLDPGIGFGKSHQHNIDLLNRAEEFHALDCPILIGHSRKGFVGKLIGDKEAERDSGTLAITLKMAEKGMHVVRVHEIAATRRALHVWAAFSGGVTADSRDQ